MCYVCAKVCPVALFNPMMSVFGSMLSKSPSWHTGVTVIELDSCIKKWYCKYNSICLLNECYISESESHGQFVVNTWSAGLDDEMVKWKQRLLLQRGMVMHKAWLWSPMRGAIFSHAWQAETSGGAWQPSVCLYVCVCVYETDTKQMCSDIPMRITFCWHKNFILIHPSCNLVFLQNLEYLAYAECS